MKKVVRNSIFIIVALFCIIYPIYIMIVQPGFFQWHLSLEENHKMLLELLIWFAIALVGCKWSNASWVMGVLIVFSYLHMMFLPAVASVLYALLTLLTGFFLLQNGIRYKGKEQLFLSYFLGMLVLTIVYAVLSAFRIGSIRNIRILDTVAFIILLVWYLKNHKNSISAFKSKCVVTRSMYVKLCALMCFLMLAIGRANVSCDVDSVWYGLRSAFVLNNQTGIYDDLKLVGCVYTYPKGYETYVLPLASETSYGYIYAGNILFAILILYVAYRIGRLFLDADKALWGSLLLAAIPGVMNMSITAKSDIITLLMQLLGIYFMLLFFRHKEGVYLGMVVATYIYAQSLKSTAVMFSTTILMVLVFVCLVYRIKPRFGKTSIWLTVLSLIDLALIWYRTYLFTGIPATSVWGKIFRAMGMKDKYPYASGQISQFRTEDLFSDAVIRATLDRMKEFFFAPNSQDTDHIVIAWGTTLCTFVLLVALIAALFRVKEVVSYLKRSALACALALLIVGEFAGCALSLWILSKPDGNYFVLYYSVTIIVGVIAVMRLGAHNPVYHSKLVTLIFCCFIPLNIVFSGATTWAWTSHFSEINWLNKGYVNHRGQFKKVMAEKGCKKIYHVMSDNPANKVLAFDTHPDVEQIPCVVESEQDVSFWGNAQLTATPENFFEFIEYEDYDYIYLGAGYVTRESGAYNNLLYLFENHRICDILIENDNILLYLGEAKDSNDSNELKNQFMEIIK